MGSGILIVEPIVQADKTESGILLPFQKPKNYREGIVVKMENMETEIALGDMVIYPNNSHSNIQYGGKACHVIKEDCIMVFQNK